MRTYCVGDIHGRADLLIKALAIATEDNAKKSYGVNSIRETLEPSLHSPVEESRFICTGDMIDRGPESAEIIKFFRNGRIGPLHLIALQGNHESMMVEVLSRNPVLPHQYQWWGGNGGRSTLMSYGYDYYEVTNYECPPLKFQVIDDVKWLACLPTFFTDDPYRIYVHGGMMSGLSLEEQDKGVCQWLRSDKVTDYGWNGLHVVHGHEQWEDGPILLNNRTNLDTYAWRTGRLAIGVFDDDVPGGPIEILWAEGPSWQTSNSNKY